VGKEILRLNPRATEVALPLFLRIHFDAVYNATPGLHLRIQRTGKIRMNGNQVSRKGFRPLGGGEVLTGARMYEMARVGRGESFRQIIESGNDYSIQVYEETRDRPRSAGGETGEPLSVERALSDPVDLRRHQRPLDPLKGFGDYIVRGRREAGPGPLKKVGFQAHRQGGGQGFCRDSRTVQESTLVLHKIMVPPGSRVPLSESPREWNVDTEVAVSKVLRPFSVTMSEWPVRNRGPVARKLLPDQPMTTGQRVIDMSSRLRKEGRPACGSLRQRKDGVSHQLAKWSRCETWCMSAAVSAGTDDRRSPGVPHLKNRPSESRSWKEHFS